ncbi:hypothetical protein FPQ18DRAFT_387099 [Pyronema domesticum]|nr:hypothetical protein FPQ18DRAFT_387099 [Pyronema domesticum]
MTNVKDSLIANGDVTNSHSNPGQMDIDNQNLMDSQCPLQLEAQPIYNAMDGGAILATILANSVATNNQLGILQQGVQNVQEQTTNLIAGLQEVYRLIEELKNNNNKSREPNDARKITTMSQNPLNNAALPAGKPGSMWTDIAKAKGKDYIWRTEIIDGKTEFSLDGTRAKDCKNSLKTAAAAQSNPVLPVKESQHPRDRQIVMHGDPEALKPDHSMIKTLIHKINQHLSDKGILEHICMDNARPTPNNWSVFSKLKANAKMLTHDKIKPLILEAARKIEKEIVDIQQVHPWPRTKIHQISLDEHIHERHST